MTPGTDTETSTVVDAHVHVGRSVYGEAQGVGELLERMDRTGIDRSVVNAFTPPDLDFRRANREVAQAARSHPDRLVGAVRVDPRLGEAAGDEIRRAAEQYGFRGLVLHPVEQGFQANDPLVFPHIELAAQLGLFVHIPTGYPVLSTPLQVAALARRYPSVPILMGHMGLNGYLFDVLQALSLSANLYVETAGHVVTGELMNGVRMCVEAGGASRVIFASGAPHFDIGVERLKIHLAGLSTEAEIWVLGGNIMRLLDRPLSGTQAAGSL